MQMPRLNRTLGVTEQPHPIKALQIGEGNFIRCFVDWMIHRLNEKGLFEGSILVTQPRPSGAAKLKVLQEQDGLFTFIERGILDGKVVDRREIVSSIAACLDPYAEWEQFLQLAEQTSLEFIFSNTTEAGITFKEEELDWNKPMHSYPGKLTAFLFRRFQKLGRDKGIVVIPSELLPMPGDALLEIVLKHVEAWQLGEDFADYIQFSCTFVNSLVDRIVTGYPSDAEVLQQELGYEDQLLAVTEPYYQWVIENEGDLAERLPLKQAGLNVEWVDDLQPYGLRKVRILNGSHTFAVPIAFMLGHDIVRDAIADSRIAEPLLNYLHQVVLPVLPFPKAESQHYIEQTLERFGNPFIDHKLLDITLNSISKLQTRLLSTLQEYAQLKGEIPSSMPLSLAYFIRFHMCFKQDGAWVGVRAVGDRVEEYQLRDEEPALAAFAELWQHYSSAASAMEWVKQVFSSDGIWEKPLDKILTQPMFEQLCQEIAANLELILESEGGKANDFIYQNS
jgi:tagaturonate reductase